MERLSTFEAEVAKTPSQRFSILLQRFEHMIEQTPSSEGLSVYIPESKVGVPAWLRLSIYVDKYRGGSDPDVDVLLIARWGHTPNAADMAHQVLSRAEVDDSQDTVKIEETLALLEVSAGYAETEFFGLSAE